MGIGDFPIPLPYKVKKWILIVTLVWTAIFYWGLFNSPGGLFDPNHTIGLKIGTWIAIFATYSLLQVIDQRTGLGIS